MTRTSTKHRFIVTQLGLNKISSSRIKSKGYSIRLSLICFLNFHSSLSLTGLLFLKQLFQNLGHQVLLQFLICVLLFCFPSRLSLFTPTFPFLSFLKGSLFRIFTQLCDLGLHLFNLFLLFCIFSFKDCLFALLLFPPSLHLLSPCLPLSLELSQPFLHFGDQLLSLFLRLCCSRC